MGALGMLLVIIGAGALWGGPGVVLAIGCCMIIAAAVSD